MTKAEMRARITFGLAVVTIGYNFLPIKPPDPVLWFAAIVCFVIAVMIFAEIAPIQPK
jgi:hypothetical protein